ncbi:unnamed protein product [Mytilus coruscus]|uniref:Uncharacterized protein n=1 Tax=Mytilus coruscus TaxID=42192 RepID=A0A6J8E9P1_MYTCO|nr:unnamed protein product [Mytilus coruscus]
MISLDGRQNRRWVSQKLERFLLQFVKIWVYQFLRKNISAIPGHEFFVVYEIDTRLMEVRLPIDKLAKCHNLITVVLQKEKKMTCAVVSPGRAFLRRLIDLTIGVKKSFHRIRMTKSVKQDLNTWQHFLKNFNGKSLILSDRWLTSDQLHLFTDASGTYGYGALFGSQWFLGKWDTKMAKTKYCLFRAISHSLGS